MANTVLFTVVGLTHGIDVLPALGNVAVALLGNFVGGGLLIGGYYAYANDDSRWLRRRPHEDKVRASEPAERTEVEDSRTPTAAAPVGRLSTTEPVTAALFHGGNRFTMSSPAESGPLRKNR